MINVKKSLLVLFAGMLLISCASVQESYASINSFEDIGFSYLETNSSSNESSMEEIEVEKLFLPSSEDCDYSFYYTLDYFKGIEIYCWIGENNDWECGALPGTNRNKSPSELRFLQVNLPCSLPEMKDILLTYPETARDTFIIFVIPYPVTEQFLLSENWRKESTHDYNTNYLYHALGLKKDG